MDQKTESLIGGLLRNNIPDVFAIITIIGAEKAAECAPHLLNILKTISAAQAAKP